MEFVDDVPRAPLRRLQRSPPCPLTRTRDWKSSARRGLTTRRSSPLVPPSDLKCVWSLADRNREGRAESRWTKGNGSYISPEVRSLCQADMPSGVLPVWSAPRLDCSPWGRKMRQEAPWASIGGKQTVGGSSARTSSGPRCSGSRRARRRWPSSVGSSTSRPSMRTVVGSRGSWAVDLLFRAELGGKAVAQSPQVPRSAEQPYPDTRHRSLSVQGRIRDLNVPGGTRPPAIHSRTRRMKSCSISTTTDRRGGAAQSVSGHDRP